MPKLYRFNTCRELGRNGRNVTYDAVDTFSSESVILIGWHAEDDPGRLDAIEHATGAESFHYEGSYYLVTSIQSAAPMIDTLRKLDLFGEAWTGLLPETSTPPPERNSDIIRDAVVTEVLPEVTANPVSRLGSMLVARMRVIFKPKPKKSHKLESWVVALLLILLLVNSFCGSH